MTKKKDAKVTGREIAVEMNRRRWSKPGAKQRAKKAAKARWVQVAKREAECALMADVCRALADQAATDGLDTLSTELRAAYGKLIESGWKSAQESEER